MHVVLHKKDNWRAMRRSRGRAVVGCNVWQSGNEI